MNLRYNDPADPSEGGRWFLMGQTTPDANNVGIAAISAYLSNIDIASAVFGNPTAAGGYPVVTDSATTLNANVDTAGGLPFKGTFGGAINIVYGQDNSLSAPNGLLAGVGASGGGLVATDPLRNTAWNNSTLIMSGTFAGARPAFVAAGANSTDANTLENTTLGNEALDANVVLSVRGDSLETLNLEGANKGLQAGDANRDGIVNGSDFAIMAGVWQQTGKTWDQGNFNDDVGGVGIVNGSDFALLAGNWQSTQQPIAVVGVPEPSSVALVMVITGLMVARRRRR